MGDREQLLAMLTGYRISSALSVAAELAISDCLADGPRTVEDLAAELKVDGDSLLRLLRVLSATGVYAEVADGTYANTSLGEGLLTDSPGGLRPLARMMQDAALWAAWGHLGHSVRTGENAFKALHGMDVWEHRIAHPERNEIFNDNMAALSSRTAGAVAEAYDFGGKSTVIDVGGGQGALLAAVLGGHPHLTGTVFDQEHVVSPTPPAGASDSVASRWSVASGNFFEAVPAADVLLLKWILHDWPDDRCVTILKACRQALGPDGVVLVVESLLGHPGHEVEVAFSDLNMLACPGGRERTEAQYATLFAAADLELTGVFHTSTSLSIIEARIR